MSEPQLPSPDICLRSVRCECGGYVDYEPTGFNIHIRICPNCLPVGNRIQFDWTDTIHFTPQTISSPRCYRLCMGMATWDVLEVGGVGTSPEYGSQQYKLTLNGALGGGALSSVALTIEEFVTLVIAEGPDPLPMGVFACRQREVDTDATTNSTETTKNRKSWIPLPETIIGDVRLGIQSAKPTEFTVEIDGTDFRHRGHTSDQGTKVPPIPKVEIDKAKQNGKNPKIGITADQSFVVSVIISSLDLT